jgi:hypothetical protein
MTRQRQVYPRDQVIHIWAHQSQEHARSGSNVSFDGKLLYSYSTVIAQIETDQDGQTWAFLSSESLTPTTSKHVGTSRQATRHLNRFFTPAFAIWSRYGRTIKEMIEPAIKQAIDDLKEAFAPRKRATTKADAISRYNSRCESIREVIAAFGIENTTPLPEVDPELTAKWVEDAKVYDKIRQEQNKARKEREEREAAEQRAKDQKQVERWLTAGEGYFPRSFKKYHEDQITIKGDIVTTSQGAEAPLDHVIKALEFYMKRAHTGQDDGHGAFLPYHTNGHKIALGHFTLDSIDEQGNVKAGCHYFTAQEIARFINQWQEVLGL